MEKILEIYLIATNIIAFVSLVGFVALISNKISQKHPFKVMGWIFLFLTIVGMYLFIPSRLFISGVVNQNISYLETAIRLSINPIEKKLCKEFSNSIQGKLTPELSAQINKIRKADLLLFELQNAYNLKIKEYTNKLRTD